MEGATGGPLPDNDGSQTKYSITLREADIAQISMALKDSFRGDLHTEMATLVKISHIIRHYLCPMFKSRK